jgi:hypothetical protein
MRTSLNGFLLSSIFSASLVMFGCSGKGSILGDESPEFAKSAEGELGFERAPFSQAGMDSASEAAYKRFQAAASQPASGGSDLLNTGFEGESASCWNHVGITAGCGDFLNMGGNAPGAFALSENGVAHGGKKAVQITYAKNEELAGTDVNIKSDVVNVRAWYYFDEGFDFGQGMKIGRVSSFNTSTHLNDIDIILEIRSAIGTNQCGTSDMRDVGLFFNGAPKGSDWGSISSSMTFNRKQWYAIEYQVKLNAPGKADGSVSLWVDGALKVEKKNLSIRGSGTAPLNTVKIGGWYSNGLGGNSCPNPASVSRLYMDDVVIAKSFIGTR